MALVFLLQAWAAPAGTVIRNQALAFANGLTYLSNVVETVVQAVCTPALSPSGSVGNPTQYAVVPAGGFVYFSYLLRNSGNQGFTFNLGWIQDSAPWTPSSVRFYHDINANGQPDPGETELNSVTLAAGQEIRLVLALQTPLSAYGDLHISPVATCPDGVRDDDNFSRVRIGSGAALNVSKSADTLLAREGQEVGFNVRVLNLGNARAGGPIYVTDMLDTPELGGLSYVVGSANASKGQLEFSDGSSWSTSPPAQVRGIRLVLAGLEVGEEALFSFRMRVEPGAVPGFRRNVVTVGEAQAAAELRIAAQHAHALGPLGNPQAVGPDDRQSASVLAGQIYCFRHTLHNMGNAPDAYTLEATGLPSGVSLSLRSLGGGSLSLPIALPPGADFDFQACLSGLSTSTPPFTMTLLARSEATGQTDPTFDQVLQVLDTSQIALRKSSRMGPRVTPGERVVYTLEIKNPLPISLGNVVVEDVLDGHLEFISASHGGSYTPSSRTVRWNLTLDTGETHTLTLEVRVADNTPHDTAIPNQFSLRGGFIGNPLLSNSVTLQVQAAMLLMEKQLQPTRARVGDLLTYTLTVVNMGQVALTVRLEDTPEAPLIYVPGSASPSEPLLQGGKLIWNNLSLAPGARVVVTYKMRIGAGAGPQLRNTAQAIGSDGSGDVVASAEASAVVQLQQGVFAPPHSLLGRVFLDTDRDGRYTAGLDLPLPGVRVLLSNGLQVLTDAEGRYSFRNLTGGVFEVMLDPASAPFRPLPHPEALGDGYRHRMRVEGLTVSDFPLERPSGLAWAMRETTLEFGPLRVEKKLLPIPAGVRVVLVLSSSEILPELTLTDPLPDGGERVFRFERFQGRETLTYDLPGGHLTDPQARWRYP